MRTFSLVLAVSRGRFILFRLVLLNAVKRTWAAKGSIPLGEKLAGAFYFSSNAALLSALTKKGE